MPNQNRKSETNKSTENDKENLQNLEQPNGEEHNSESNEQSGGIRDLQEQQEQTLRSDQSKITSSRDLLNSDATTSPKATSKSSRFYVLQRDEHTTTLKRSCHLPRTVGVNIQARRKLIIASVLCIIFMTCEIIGGLLSNSLAIAADAAHSLTDFAGFMISLFAIWLAARNPTDRLSFGWHRAEVIGALTSIITIWCVTAVLVWLAIQRCIDRNFEINAVIMMITAVFAIVTNIALGILLMHDSTKKERRFQSIDSFVFEPKSRQNFSHSHGSNTKVFKKLQGKLQTCMGRPKKVQNLKGNSNPDGIFEDSQNINIRAAFLHVLSDGLQSVGVLVAGIIIYIRPDWVLADPICTFIFAILVLYTTIQILKDILLVLMEGTPTYMDYSEVQKTFEEIEGVKSVHSLRIWGLSLDKVALAVHLVIEQGVDAKIVLQRAEEVIHINYHLYETTIQIEEDT